MVFKDDVGSESHSTVRKVAVGIAGGIVLLAGALMLILPGPAVVVIPTGLAILATEFGWAKRWLHWARDKIRERYGHWRKAEEDSPRRHQEEEESRRRHQEEESRRK